MLMTLKDYLKFTFMSITELKSVCYPPRIGSLYCRDDFSAYLNSRNVNEHKASERDKRAVKVYRFRVFLNSIYKAYFKKIICGIICMLVVEIIIRYVSK